ncbi:MAG TPA: glycosyltransferase family 4 protein [Thermoanaerobaculia bacterium]|jgi:glycosyltransferase involved in cell wall biosynthesis|nr:glycosyltransferase family 4 protein [Thermoanaerobaculia bacterium]
MKVAILSESPSLTTGFGVVCAQIASAVASAGHQVVCFGIGAFGETFDRSKYPCRIWAVGCSDLIPAFCDFLSYEQPDALIVSIDILAVQHWVSVATAVGWKKPIIAHFVVDGLPLGREYFAFLSSMHARITPTRIVADYLAGKGVGEVLVAPHGVDTTVFKPLPNRGALRREAGLSNRFVVGVFGRNNERKQQPRVMMGVALLRKKNQAKDVALYLHCQPQDEEKLGGWDLAALAESLGIEDQVFFPGHSFEQVRGVSTADRFAKLGSKTSSAFEGYSYVERINCCDLIVNPSFCGGFELAIIEAQACGVPVAVTDDQGIMKEVAGSAACFLPAVDLGIWRTGAYQHFVAPKTIASAISRLRRDIRFRERLCMEGLENVKKYASTNLGEVVNGALATIRTPVRKRRKEVGG